MDSNGVPFTTAYIASTGNPIVDLSEDMAAEEKARAKTKKDVSAYYAFPYTEIDSNRVNP